MTTNHPLRELTIARIREFLREPEAVFWTYGFPLMLAVGLGIAFRDRPVELAHVDVQAHARAADIAARLASRDDLVVAVRGEAECRDRLRLGRSSLVVVPGDPVTFVFDPSRPESALARERVNDALQRAAGRRGSRPDLRHPRHRARGPLHRLPHPRAAGHEPDERQPVGRGLRHRRHAREEAAEAPGGHADDPPGFSLVHRRQPAAVHAAGTGGDPGRRRPAVRHARPGKLAGGAHAGAARRRRVRGSRHARRLPGASASRPSPA